MTTNSDYQLFLENSFGELIEKLDLTENQDTFMRMRWLDQFIWLENKAGQNQASHLRYKRITIILSAIIPALVGVTFYEGVWEQAIKTIAVILSVIAAVITGLTELFGYGDKWNLYRKTAESLKSEFWLFYTLTGPYHNYANHNLGFNQFSSQVERLLNDDVQYFVTKIAPDN